MSKYAYRFICLLFQFCLVNDKQILKDFGTNLKNIRLSQNITQEKLAFSIGVEISQISRIERGVINTSVLSTIKIANALNINPKQLLDFSFENYTAK